MQVVGIVAEYNPFHTGHAYQIARTRAELGEGRPCGGGDERLLGPGGAARRRTSGPGAGWPLTGGGGPGAGAAHGVGGVLGGDLCPGAVGILAAAGVVDVLSFGSECGAADRLRQVAACLEQPGL